MNKKLSLILNITIFILTLFASVIMFTGIKFMDGDLLLESTKLGMFRFFTVDSNLFMGIVSLIFVIYEIKKKEITKGLYILKLMSTTAVTITFLVVFFYLGYVVNGGLPILLKNSNLFFHLIIPILSIICFIFFEKTNKLNFKKTFYGILPTIIYGIFYLTNVLIHVKNGKVEPKYDWYLFVQGGMHQTFIIFPVMLLISYLISLLLWKLNKRGA